MIKDTGKVAVGVDENILKGDVRLEPSTEPPLLPAAEKAISNSSLPAPSRPPPPKKDTSQQKRDSHVAMELETKGDCTKSTEKFP